MTQSIAKLQTYQLPDKNIRTFSDPNNTELPDFFELWQAGFGKTIRSGGRPPSLVWAEVVTAAAKMERDYKAMCSKAGLDPADQNAPVDVFVGVPIPAAHLKQQLFKLVEHGLWRIAHSEPGSRHASSTRVKALTVLSELYGLVEQRLTKPAKAGKLGN